MNSLIFDLDGTLWNTVDVVVRSWNQVLKNNGVDRQIQAEDVHGMMGKSHPELVDYALPGLPRELVDKIIRDSYTNEQALLREGGAELYSGVQTGLEKLAHRFSLYLVSNCQTQYKEVFLDWSETRAFFSRALCHGDTGLSKAENLSKLLNEEAISVSEAVYVGDTQSDADSARAAGLPLWWVSYGFGKDIACAQEFDAFYDLVDFALVE